jgi:hypothetical protein
MIEEKKKKKKSHYTEFRAASAFQKAPALFISSFTIKNRHFGGVFHIKIGKISENGSEMAVFGPKIPFFRVFSAFFAEIGRKRAQFLMKMTKNVQKMNKK